MCFPSLECAPQRLKPHWFCGTYGAAERRPFKTGLTVWVKPRPFKTGLTVWLEPRPFKYWTYGVAGAVPLQNKVKIRAGREKPVSTIPLAELGYCAVGCLGVPS
jgi:hypothetical protein